LINNYSQYKFLNKQIITYSNPYQYIIFSGGISDTTHNAGEENHSIFK